MPEPIVPPPHLTFYHTVEYAPGRRTAGWPVIVPIVEMIRTAMQDIDFRGRRVLDIGCCDGALSFEAERLGAAEVLGVDFDLPRDNIAFLAGALGSRACFEQRNIYELRPDTVGQFDIVLLPGVVYHLRYPFLALRLMRDLLKDGGTLLVETATCADANRLPLVLCPTGKASPYEPTSCTFFNIKGFVDTARSLGLLVAWHRSLMNLPPQEPALTEPLPIDRTVFLCVRDRSLDDPDVLDYWDGGADTPKLADWMGKRG
jgi:SAM-dependent methyltransferase